MSASLGTYGKFGFDTASPVTKRFQYKDETLIGQGEIVNGNGVRGTRSHSIEVVRDGLFRVGGPVNLIPTAVELSNLLQAVLGGAPTGTTTKTYPLAESLPLLYCTIDRVIKVHTYSGCKVDKATFRASQGSNLEVALEFVGQDETVGNAGTFPVLSLDVANGPFVFMDLSLSVNGVTVSAKELTVTVNNMLDKERFLNSLTLTQTNELDREITFATTVPYGDYQQLYGAGGAAGVACVATFTNGGAVLTMTMPKVALLKHAPGTPGRAEIFLPLEGRAFRSGSTPGTNDELSVTLAVGP